MSGTGLFSKKFDENQVENAAVESLRLVLGDSFAESELRLVSLLELPFCSPLQILTINSLPCLVVKTTGPDLTLIDFFQFFTFSLFVVGLLLRQHNLDPNTAANFAFERMAKGLPLNPQTHASPSTLKRTPSSSSSGTSSPQGSPKKHKSKEPGLSLSTSTAPFFKKGHSGLLKASGSLSAAPHSEIPFFGSEEDVAAKKDRRDLEGMVESEFPKRIGEMVAMGYSLVNGRGLVRIGDDIAFERILQKISTASANSKRFGHKKRDNTIVRLLVRGREVGKLASDSAAFVSKLLDLGIVSLGGTIVDAPDPIALMDNLLITIEIKLPLHVFQTRTFGDDEVQKQRISSLNYVFDKIGKIPLQASRHRVLLDNRKNLKSAPGLDPDQPTSPPGTPDGKTEPIPEGDAPHDPAALEPQTGEEPQLTELELSDLYQQANQRETELVEASQPETMNYLLRPYQRQALAWMLSKESPVKSGEGQVLHPLWEEYAFENHLPERFYWNSFSGELRLDFPHAGDQVFSGILADEMGLGKTVEMISLIHSHPCPPVDTEKSVIEGSSEPKKAEQPLQKKMPFSKATLVVCPMSLLGQWVSELTDSAKKASSLKVLSYYGDEREKGRQILSTPDVIVTTYGILCSDFDPASEQQAGGLFSVEFHRVILDEAHIIKNRASLTARAAYSLSSKRRWAVSGTPIQNRLEDLFSLLKFIQMEPWSNFSFWKTHIEDPFESKDGKAAQTLSSILSQVMLRRTKDSKDERGLPIIQLPPKDCKLMVLEFSHQEREFYQAIFRRAKAKFDDLYLHGSVMKNYASVLAILLRLRQACDHPRLLSEEPEVVHEESQEQPTIDPFADCPFCLEPLGDLAVVTPCQHSFCYDCMIEYMKKQKGEIECPVCRKGALRERDLTVLRQNGEEGGPQKRTIVFPQSHSTKTLALLKALKEVRDKDPTAKSVVFSQWTSMLDLLHEPLASSGFKFLRLDGTVPQAQREEVLSAFKTGEVLILLVSLRAGGVGLNLTAACNCYLIDLWWNPAVEEQAIDRVHRIGQTKEVSVTRFVIKDTVEEKLLRTQSRKRQLANAALSQNKDQLAQERLDDLVTLFSD